MMSLVLSTQELNKLKKGNRKIVLVGGCFDIIHEGHIEFLKKSKAKGDILVVFVESDRRIKELKGEKRPINDQETRTRLLSHLKPVDVVIPLPYMERDNDYEILVKQIEPDIIAITRGTKVYTWEEEYAKETGAKIVEVMDRKEAHSTTKLVDSMKL